MVLWRHEAKLQLIYSSSVLSWLTCRKFEDPFIHSSSLLWLSYLPRGLKTLSTSEADVYASDLCNLPSRLTSLVLREVKEMKLPLFADLPKTLLNLHAKFTPLSSSYQNQVLSIAPEDEKYLPPLLSQLALGTPYSRLTALRVASKH